MKVEQNHHEWERIVDKAETLAAGLHILLKKKKIVPYMPSY